MSEPGGGWGLMKHYNRILAIERSIRQTICFLVGHRDVRAIGDFDYSLCLRCWQSIDAPDVPPSRLIQTVPGYITAPSPRSHTPCPPSSDTPSPRDTRTASEVAAAVVAELQR